MANYINGGHYSPHHDYIIKEKDSSFVSIYFLAQNKQYNRQFLISDDNERSICVYRRSNCHLDVLRKLIFIASQKVDTFEGKVKKKALSFVLCMRAF